MSVGQKWPIAATEQQGTIRNQNIIECGIQPKKNGERHRPLPNSRRQQGLLLVEMEGHRQDMIGGASGGDVAKVAHVDIRVFVADAKGKSVRSSEFVASTQGIGEPTFLEQDAVLGQGGVDIEVD